ncbi:helix-turn-helix domain-containing protein [Enterobacter bugandensis]|uniref:helix-turn-helix domain-containing protein n=1 Tax=Enterobacter bugandensis TaxID=881260 RepID=UPI00131EF574|nr:helix-turn-helix domain-containing protein [Enterobacter bugandensis]QWZ48818.1 helix-turn-helix domain-containing protein [Enterobacter bugandensis]UBH41111.1 helix-turn-helix domain-containing protein [Enterobacter bugandensis]UBH92790.1 helix-turn-helix domain-containing protein [Enterobacter bugandensis]UBH99422.1 helix-turn-helix domain-containing protein [Enterobacter bugandensis]
MRTSPQDNNEFNHPFEFIAGTKPIKAIEEMFTALLPFGSKKIITRGSSINLEKINPGGGVLLIQDGFLSGSSAASEIVKSTFLPPSIVGIIDSYSFFYNVPGRSNHIFYAETEVVSFFVPIQKFIEICDSQPDLWHNVARILAHRLMVATMRNSALVGGDAYTGIKQLLEEIDSFPNAYKQQINVPYYIVRRTGVSRSRVMKILSDLKMGGYIIIKDGKLIQLNNLPAAY